MCHISHDWDKVFKGSDRLPKSALARMAISNNKSVVQCRAKRHLNFRNQRKGVGNKKWSLPSKHRNIAQPSQGNLSGQVHM